MKFTVILTNRARKQLKKLDRAIQERLQIKIDELEHNPRPAGAIKLTGYNYWRIRVGDYRIVYEIQGEQLIISVIHVAHRREVYDTIH